jgi:hypothetical protein
MAFSANIRRTRSASVTLGRNISKTFDRVVVRLPAREFDEVTSGARPRIHLPINQHWSRAMVGKDYKNLVLSRGYLASKQIEIPWPGYRVESVRSSPSGPEVVVFTLDVSDAAESRQPSGAHAACSIIAKH